MQAQKLQQSQPVAANNPLFSPMQLSGPTSLVAQRSTIVVKPSLHLPVRARNHYLHRYQGTQSSHLATLASPPRTHQTPQRHTASQTHPEYCSRSPCNDDEQDDLATYAHYQVVSAQAQLA